MINEQRCDAADVRFVPCVRGPIRVLFTLVYTSVVLPYTCIPVGLLNGAFSCLFIELWM